MVRAVDRSVYGEDQLERARAYCARHPALQAELTRLLERKVKPSRDEMIDFLEMARTSFVKAPAPVARKLADEVALLEQLCETQKRQIAELTWKNRDLASRLAACGESV
jgi:phage shock protein A